MRRKESKTEDKFYLCRFPSTCTGNLTFEDLFGPTWIVFCHLVLKMLITFSLQGFWYTKTREEEVLTQWLLKSLCHQSFDHSSSEEI